MKTTAISLFALTALSGVTAQFGSLDGIDDEIQQQLLAKCITPLTALLSCVFPNGFNATNPEDEAFLSGCQSCLNTELNGQGPTTDDPESITCDELDAQVTNGVTACETECRASSCRQSIDEGFSCIFQELIDCETGELKVNITTTEDDTKDDTEDDTKDDTTTTKPASGASMTAVSSLVLGSVVAWLLHW